MEHHKNGTKDMQPRVRDQNTRYLLLSGSTTQRKPSQVIEGGTLSWLERLNWEVSPFQASRAVQEHITIASGHKIYKKSVEITVELVLVPILLVGTPYLTLSDLPPVFTFLFPSRGTAPNLGCHQIQFWLCC